MSNMSQLAAELDELRHCGEILIGISDTLREMFSGSEKTQEEQETPAEKTKGKAKAAKAAPAKEPEKSSSPLRMSGRYLPRSREPDLPKMSRR